MLVLVLVQVLVQALVQVLVLVLVPGLVRLLVRLLVRVLVLEHEQSLVLERLEHHPRTQSRCTIHHPVRVSEVETPPHSAAKQSWQQLVLVPVPVPVLAPELVLQLELQAERPSVMLPALVGRS